ncbi:probable galacturonosyltransferase 10 [Salvia splendens]|uniref:probable galacturonosyltransferase 10 n=1 Tax=Salvia splendens TaxID=180675 RepID=UPI001C275545|nr:probable galacturonosyltransferase 10 [Salvia splendens]
MRRRGADYRRLVRRKFPNALWLTFCGFVILLFILVLRRANHRLTSRSVYAKRPPRQERFADGLNITDEMLSPDSLTRQLNDQISLAKGFLVIAKESNNLQFAWELSAQIRNSQILVSNAVLRRTPLAISESGTAVLDMALLLIQAQQLRYDSATVIMRLKAKIQGLEQQMSSTNEKSAKYGQIAAEEVPKSLFCLGVRLTGEWFRNAYLQRKLKENRQTALKLKDNSLYHFCVFSGNIDKLVV